VALRDAEHRVHIEAVTIVIYSHRHFVLAKVEVEENPSGLAVLDRVGHCLLSDSE
jgi:hypothetical protein